MALTLVPILFAGILVLALRLMTLETSSRPPERAGKRIAEKTGVPIRERSS